MTGKPQDVYAAAQYCHETCAKVHIVGSGCEVSPLTPAG